MAEAQHVAVPGGFTPPAIPGATGGQPAAQTPPSQGFAPVPPAGGAPRVPNGNPIEFTQPAPPQAQQQPAQQQPVTMDAAAITALVQQALGKNEQQPAQPEQPERPAWMPESINKFDANTIQDPVIRSMAGILQASGKDLDLDRVLGNALQHNDENLIDFAYIREKGGQNAAQLAMLAKGIVQAVGAKADSIAQGIYTTAGGEAAWKQAVAVFNQTAPQEFKTAVKYMLDSTNETSIQSGAKLLLAFAAQSGVVPQQGSMLPQGAAAAGAASALSKDQFKAELGKLRPDAPDFIASRDALFQRRAQGKRLGL